MAACGEEGTEFLMFPHCMEKAKFKLVSHKEERLKELELGSFIKQTISA